MTLIGEIIDITMRSMMISGSAAFIATIIGLPIGLSLGLFQFRGRETITVVFRTLMSMPTVALGLLLYLLFSRAGPLGIFQLLYSPFALVIGQAILILPIMISITTETVESVSPSVRDLALTLGADERGAAASVVRESLGGIILAISASFSRAISELGVALMIGGNIQGITRVLTTSIALETTRGQLALGLGLTVILLVIVVTFNALLNRAERRLKWWLWE